MRRCSPFGRIKIQHLRQQVNGLRVSLREELLEWNSGSDGQRANVVLRSGRADPPQGVLRGSTEVVQDLVQLIDIAVEPQQLAASNLLLQDDGYALPAFEDRLACQKLCENTANAPHVDGRCLD